MKAWGGHRDQGQGGVELQKVSMINQSRRGLGSAHPREPREGLKKRKTPSQDRKKGGGHKEGRLDRRRGMGLGSSGKKKLLIGWSPLTRRRAERRHHKSRKKRGKDSRGASY